MQDECPKKSRPDQVATEPAAEPSGPAGRGRPLVSESLLLLASAIWGFAFVAQRVAMDHIGPFTFNAVRFALGSLPMLPLMALARNRAVADAESGATPGTTPREPSSRPPLRMLLTSGLAAGALLYGGASLQQFGIVYTTAGKAGFITGLYVILVPILGLFWKMRPGATAWVGAGLGVVGLFLLSVNERFAIGLGDSLVLAGAFFWAGHVILVGWLIRRIDVGTLAFIQFVTCAVLSFLTALIVEDIRMDGILAAAGPILYGGFVSVGIAYTLQLVGQRRTPPSHAAIILGLEAVFAALGGWAVLGETLSARALVGCALILVGVIVSQLRRGRTPAAGGLG
jgi:drug/metabolite transporter (DMT)-like permease